jgi:hypothetical protein
MPRHFLNFRRSAITKINFRVASLGNIKSAMALEISREMIGNQLIVFARKK